MNPIGLVFVGGGLVLVFGGVTGRDPLAMVKNTVSGQPLPAAGSWGASAAPGVVSDKSAPGDRGIPEVSGVESVIRTGIIKFAQAQLGESYVLGTEGPNTWDCSGLTMKAYRSQGIYLPRTSILQSAVGFKIPIANAQLGDLIFFGSPVHHVGLFYSHAPDTILHAPHTGTVVKYEQVWNFEPSFARNAITGRTRRRNG